MRPRSWPVTCWALVLVASCALPVLAQEAKRESRADRPTNRDRSDFTFLKDEGFPLNLDPKIISAAEAELGDGDMVMGIEIAGEARAYPVNYMNGPFNEVVNDHLGGQAIAPSW